VVDLPFLTRKKHTLILSIFWTAQAAFVWKIILAGGWAFPAFSKAGAQIIVMVDGIPADIYAEVGS
jgi:hypothetical protein